MVGNHPPNLVKKSQQFGRTIRRAYFSAKCFPVTRIMALAPQTHCPFGCCVGRDMWKPLLAENSIAFGSAPRREADSQPISQLDRPAVSQTETHSLGFLSVADRGPSSGENNWSQSWQWANGNAGGRGRFGRRFEPCCGQYGSGAAGGVHRPGFEPPTEKSAAGCVTIRPGVDVTQMCLPLLGAFSAKTFDPPPPTPPPKKVISSFRG